MVEGLRPVSEGSWARPVPLSEDLDELRGLAVAHEPRHVGDRERLVGEEIRRVAQPNGAQVGVERGQTDRVEVRSTWRGEVASVRATKARVSGRR